MTPSESPTPDSLGVTFAMSKDDLLRIREELPRYFASQPLPVNRLQRLAATAVAVMTTAIVVFVLRTAYVHGREMLQMMDWPPVLASIGFVVITAGLIRWWRGSERQAIARKIRSTPLSVDELMLLGPHSVSIRHDGCSVATPHSSASFPASSFDTVNVLESLVVLALLPRQVYIIPKSAFVSPDACREFSDRASAMFAKFRDPAGFVQSLLQHEAVPCPRCGYSLQRAGSATCPECGKLVTVDSLLARDPKRTPPPR